MSTVPALHDMVARHHRLCEMHHANTSPAQAWLEHKWRSAFVECPPNELPQRLAACSPDDLAVWFADIFGLVDELVTDDVIGKLSSADDPSVDLLVQAALLVLQQWARSDPGFAPLADQELPQPQAPGELEAAFLAAVQLGMNLRLRVHHDAAGQTSLTVDNLVTDTPEVQLGRVGDLDALRQELLKRCQPGSYRGGLLDDRLLKAFVDRHARQTGARLIVALPEHAADTARHAMRLLGTGAYLRASAQPATPDAIRLAQSVRTQLEMLAPVLARVTAAARPPGPIVPPPKPDGPPIVFISYAHANKALREEFVAYLRQYERGEAARLRVWADDRIEMGDNWEPLIRQAMAQCAVAVLLLTKEFMYSEFIREQEFPTLKIRRDGGEIRIVPIHMTPCAVDGLPPLPEWQVVPSDTKAVPEAGREREELLNAIAKKIAEHCSARIDASTDTRP